MSCGLRKSCKPPYQRQCCLPMDLNTTYCKSYPGHCPCPSCTPPRMRREGKKTMCCPMDCRTVHRMTYQVHSGRPAIGGRPPCKDLISGGRDCRWLLTTQRHDYIPKSTIKLLPIKKDDLPKKHCPMECNSIMRASYPPPGRCERRCPFKTTDWPHPVLCFDGCTVARLSYPPPGGCKAPMCRPPEHICHSHMPFECSTIYRCSYKQPCVC